MLNNEVNTSPNTDLVYIWALVRCYGEWHSKQFYDLPLVQHIQGTQEIAPGY